MRTVNGTAQSADFNTHSGGAFSAGTYLWTDIERTDDNRPIAYVASGSHGVWPTPGRHVYAQVRNVTCPTDYSCSTSGHSPTSPTTAVRCGTHKGTLSR